VVKRLLILIPVVFQAAFLFAQGVNIKSAISGGDSRKIYRGTTTAISIEGLPKNVSFRMKHSLFNKLNGDTYVIRTPYCEELKRDTLDIYSGKDLYDTKVFEVVSGKVIPPQVVVGSCNKLYWKKSELFGMELRIIPDNLKCTVDSFEFTIAPKRGELIGPYIVKGNRINVTIWNKLRIMNNDVIYFRVYARCDSLIHNREYSYDDFVIRIKD
jgi:hypothetical protein